MFKSILLVLLLSANVVFAQIQVKNYGIRERLTHQPTSLLDFLQSDKVSFSNSVSSSFSTSGNGSALTNLFVSTMTYKFNEKLTGNFSFGLLNQPYNTFYTTNNYDKNNFVGSFKMDYKPTKNTELSVSFNKGLTPSQENSFFGR
ncbi:hypothetical protein IT568_07145 [bacterium]|nr:hypothetical protein [bacterium]